MLLDERGNVRPALMSNLHEMLRDHDETKGMFKRNGRHIMVVRRPPWVNGEGTWAPRKLSQDDIFFTRIWLETKGLRPQKPLMRTIICALADEPC